MNELVVKEEIKATENKGVASLRNVFLCGLFLWLGGLGLGQFRSVEAFSFGFVSSIVGLFVINDFRDTARQIQIGYHRALRFQVEFSDQRGIEDVLSVLAATVGWAAKDQQKAQQKVAQSSPDLEPEFRKGELEATNYFNKVSTRFYDACNLASASGFDVLVTGEGKYSFKLYLPKSEVPQSTPSSEDSHYNGCPGCS
mgnify:CR=1 FL=1